MFIAVSEFDVCNRTKVKYHSWKKNKFITVIMVWDSEYDIQVKNNLHSCVFLCVMISMFVHLWSSYLLDT